jgi:hypothetical protein
VAGVVGEQDVRVGGQCRGEHVAVLGVHVDLVDGGEVLRGDLDEGVLGVGRRSAPTVLTVTWSMSFERASTTPMMMMMTASRRFGRFRVDRR